MAYVLKKPVLGPATCWSAVPYRDAPVVDLAYEAQMKGLKIIVITSMSYTTQVESVYSSGKKLYELADVVMDNCASAAEAMMEVEGLEPRLCVVSGIAATFLMWSVTMVVLARKNTKGSDPYRRGKKNSFWPARR